MIIEAGTLFKRKNRTSGQFEIFMLARVEVNKFNLINMVSGESYSRKSIIASEVNHEIFFNLTEGEPKRFLPIGREASFSYLFKIEPK